jgi:hypothetical protein
LRNAFGIISCVILLALLSGCNKPQPNAKELGDPKPAPTYKTHITDTEQIDFYIDWKAHVAQVERYKGLIGNGNGIGSVELRTNLAALQQSCRYFAQRYNAL